MYHMDEYGPRCKSYNRSNISNARKMRKNPTLAEQKMRQDILKNRPLGYKFTRQKPIGSFIADFYCAKLSLIIEVDGEVHKKTKEYDRERTTYMINQGISVARYYNNQVLKDIDRVYKDLLIFIKEIENEKIN